MSNADPNKNCHDYCPYGKCCRFSDGGNGWDWQECAMYYKIDDLMMDAMDIEKEQKKQREFEECDDW